jgi:hypothetical protein
LLKEKDGLVIKPYGEKMRSKRCIRALLALILLGAFATSSSAEVKRVQMHIAGYLCGN